MGVSTLQLVNLYTNRRYFVIKLHTWFCLSYFLKTNIKLYRIYQYFMSINSFFQHRICLPIQPQLQFVNLHRNRRYFVIKLHTWFCLSYFLKTNINFIAFINILWVSTVFSTPYLFLDTAARLQWPWPRVARSSSFFSMMLFKKLPIFHVLY